MPWAKMSSGQVHPGANNADFYKCDICFARTKAKFWNVKEARQMAGYAWRRDFNEGAGADCCPWCNDNMESRQDECKNEWTWEPVPAEDIQVKYSSAGRGAGRGKGEKAGASAQASAPTPGLHERFKEMETTMLDMSAQSSSLHVKFVEMQKTMKDMQEEIDFLRKKNDKVEDTLDDYEDHVDDLKARIVTLEKSMNANVPTGNDGDGIERPPELNQLEPNQ